MKDYLKELVLGEEELSARNLTREYLQSRILREFQLAGAMATLAFHGGTCLRFIYGLPRYSEDLDFALEIRSAGYDLEGYLRKAQSQLLKEAYKVEASVRQHRKAHRGLIRFPGLLHDLGLSPLPSETLAIRIEVDTNPPSAATTEVKVSRRHIPLRLFCHDRATLLAGKVHAILQRPYAKGRDWYDLIWYLSAADWSEPNIDMLNAALLQTDPSTPFLTEHTWRQSVLQRMHELDWNAVTNDVIPFLVDQREIDLLNKNDIERILV